MAIISNAVTIADAGAFSVGLGAMTHIKTLTASSSANLSFVHGSSSVVLDSTYPIYKFEFINIHPQTDGQIFHVNMSLDSGSNYNVNKSTTMKVSYHSESGAGESIFFSGNALENDTGISRIIDALGADADQSQTGELYLFNPSSTTFVTHFLYTTNGSQNDNYSNHFLVGGFCHAANAINAIQFAMSSGNIDSGKIKLYGIKDS